MPHRATAPRCTCRGELFKAMTKVEMVHVPYRGSADRISRYHLQQGAADLRQSAVGARTVACRQTSRAPRRHLAAALAPGVPDVPAIAETVPGFEVGRLFTASPRPRGRRREIVDILNKGGRGKR